MAIEVSRLMVKVGADTTDAERGLQRAQSAVQGFSGGLRQVASSAVGFIAAMVGMRTIDGAVSAAKEAMLGFNASLEQSQIAWSTMLKSGEAAKAFLLDLQQFAVKTPFEFPDVERAARRFLAMGFAAKDVQPMLVAVGDAAAGLGLGAGGVDRLTIALGQMQAKGKVSAEEMLQLTEAGVNMGQVFEIMAEQTGRSVAELRKAQEQGRLTADVFIAAFVEFSRRNFGGMMEQQAKAFTGAMSAIRDSLRIVAATAFQPLFQRISELAQQIATFVQSEGFQAWGARVAATIEVILEGLGVLGDGFRVVFVGIASIVTTVGQIIYEALQLLNPFARHSPSLVESVNQGVDAIIAKFAALRAIEEPLRAAGDAVQALGEAARSGLATLEAAAEAAQMKALAVFGSAVPAAFQAARNAVQALESQLAGLRSAIEAQESVVSAVKGELDAATAAVKAKEAAIRALEREMRNYDAAVEAAEANVQRMRDAVDRAKGVVDGLRDAISQAHDRIRQLASTPIQGTQEFRDRLNDINQQINETQLKLTRLRLAGAPQEQIEALENQLDQLRLRADEVRLEESVKFDPLRRQIEKLTDSTQELPFEEIVRGIKDQQANIVGLQARLGPATSAWEQQVAALRDAEAGLKAAQAARDEFRKRIEAERLELEDLRDIQAAVQERYAAEQARLSELRDAYSAVQQRIEQYRRGLDDLTQRAEQQVRLNEQAAKAAEKAASAASAAAAAVRDPLEGLDLSEQQRRLEEWQAQFAQSVADARTQIMPTFEAIRGGIESAGATLQQVAARLNELKDPLANIAALAAATIGAFALFQHVIAPIIGTVGAIFGLKEAIAAAGGIIPKIVAALGGPLTIALVALAAVLGGLYLAWNNNWFGMRDTLDRIIVPIVNTVQNTFGASFRLAGEQVAAFAELFGQKIQGMTPFVQGLLTVIGALIAVLVGGLANVLGRMIPSVVYATIGVLTALLGAISLVADTITGVVTIIVLLLQGQFSEAWLAAEEMVMNIVGDIIMILGGLLQGVIGIIGALVAGVVGLFQTLYNVLVGRSIVPDLVTGILGWLGRLKVGWEALWGSIHKFVADTWDGIKLAVRAGVNTIIEALNTLIRAWNQLEFRIPGFDVEIPSVDVPGVGRIGGGRLSWPGIVVSTPDLPPIPALASGGITTREMLALLHPGEAVIPLRDSAALDVLAERIADAVTRRPTYQINATYSYQDERSLRDDIRMLQLLGSAT